MMGGLKIAAVFLAVMSFSPASYGAVPPGENHSYSTIIDGTDGGGTSYADSTVRLVINSRASCSGTLIGTQYVLTAAHCIDNPRTDVIDVTLGGGETIRAVATGIRRHPSYVDSNPPGMSREEYLEYIRFDAELQAAFVGVLEAAPNQAVAVVQREMPRLFNEDYDVAIVKLSRAVPAGYVPVRMATQREVAALRPGRTELILSGYGVASRADMSGVGALRYTTTTYAGRARNSNKFMEFNTDASRRTSACFGDSGGSVYVRMSGRNVLVGVISGVLKCQIGLHNLAYGYNTFITRSLRELANLR